MGRIIKTEYLDIDIDLLTVDDMPNEILKEMYELCGRDVAVSVFNGKLLWFFSSYTGKTV